MIPLPTIVSRHNLRFCWPYKDEHGKVVALVARYDMSGSKKKFHQYQLTEAGQWEEGVATPSPLYGLETLPKSQQEDRVYIFEGEKCAAALHTLKLSALTSMMGANQAQNADWAILAKYRHVKEFVLIPDNDEPGQNYMKTVFLEIQKACPQTKVSVCSLPSKNKGDDFIEWLQSQSVCPSDWDGFSPMKTSHVDELRLLFQSHVDQHCIEATHYFEELNDIPTFENNLEPFEDILSAILPCPVHLLPKEISQWIQGLALQMQISEDYLATPLLVYLGSLIGRKRGLRLRTGTDWIEYPNLWGMLIGRPSMMKSPAMKAVQKPLLKLAEKASKEHEHALQQYAIDSEGWGLRKKANDEEYKKNYKASLKGNKEKQSTYQVEECPSEPKKRRYKSEDSTTEKLGELLIENSQGLLLFRDELSGWLNSFSKAGRENDRQFFLESWSGNQEFDVDRIARGSLHVPALCLSIFGSIQPGPLSQYVHSALKGGIGDDGFIQRFQLMVWPDAKTDWELVEGIDIKELEAPIHHIFECLDRLSFNPIGEPEILSFTEEAQHLFNQWQDGYEKRIRSGNLSPHMEAHLTKYKKLLPALCIIFEHLQYAIEDKHPDNVTVETLQKAISWLDYFESHACRVYGSSSNTIPKAASDLINRVRKGDIKAPFTVREIYHGKHWSGLSNPEEVKEVLEFLEDRHYVIGQQIKTTNGNSMTGRPTKKYWVHPQIFEDLPMIKGPKGSEEVFEPFEPSISEENNIS